MSCAKQTLLQAALGPAMAPLQSALRGSARALSSRGASSSGGSGGGGSAHTPRERAAEYLKEKERKAADVAGGSDAAGGSAAPRSRLAEAAAEWSEAQQALFLSSPNGLGIGAEAAIAQAIKDGAFDNLKGKGQPLPREDHTAQFGRVDPLVAAVTRTMGAQGVKPLSLELRDEIQRDLAALRQQLEGELRLALEAGTSSQVAPSSSSSGDAAPSSSGRGGGWLGRWFGGTRSTDVASSSSGGSGSGRHTVDSIRAGRHAALQHAVVELGGLIRQYNNAVLSDKESFGAFWPLDRMKVLDWEAEVEAALAAIRSSGDGGSGSGGGDSGSSGGGGSSGGSGRVGGQ